VLYFLENESGPNYWNLQKYLILQTLTFVMKPEQNGCTDIQNSKAGRSFTTEGYALISFIFQIIKQWYLK
jgi:hypothetical protein